ncbi:MAG TPA: tetratricopeptide repeat protein [Polyangia bacterium]|nr:tetratricopeptide repeat protein [Polyangia bacterium]
MEDVTYTYGGAAKILDINESKLRYWAQTGFVGPSARRAGKPVFTFQDLVSIKAAKELVDRGFKAGQIRKALEAVRSSLPHVDRPLDRIRVTFDGDRLVVVDEGVAYETTGQRVFDFGLAELRATAQNIAEVRPRSQTPVGTQAAPKRTAYDWFAEGTLREGAPDADADAQAESCYQKALALDAGLAAAHTNLGSIAHRRGDAAEARAAFERALAIDPDQVEARFNLANLILESGDLELAVAEFRRVLQVAPDFADGHYNLAVALERLGGRAQARAHLERYLSLEHGELSSAAASSSSPWAEQARTLIARLGAAS